MAIPHPPELDAEAMLRRLVARGVDFVVIGGIAAVLYGSARITQDLDITFATDRPNLTALGEVLVALGARLAGIEEGVPFVADGETLARAEVLTLDTSAGRLDVLARPAGSPAYRSLRSRADRVDLGDFTVLVASLRDLIAMKLVAGRPKDLADVAELRAIGRRR